MKECEHNYKSKTFTHSMSGYLYVCEKCGKVKPYKHKESYFEYVLKKYGRSTFLGE